MKPYCQQEYERDPGKFELYRTARIASPIDSLLNVRVGHLVRIRFFAKRENKPLAQTVMPIYEVWADDDPQKQAWPVMLYGCALADFCL